MTSRMVYELDSGIGSQKDVLRRLIDSDCADAMGRPGLPVNVGLAFCGKARMRDAAITLAAAQLA
jgi:hypothetical protein